MMNKWPLYKAKNRFSEVVNEALDEGPQTVTRHGEETVVILSRSDYKELTNPDGSLVDFFQNSPLADIENFEIERSDSTARNVEL